MIIVKKDIPKVFNGKTILISQEQDQAMNMLADSISINRGPLLELLQSKQINVTASASNKELLDAAINNLKKSDGFKKEFVKAYSKTISNVDGQDSTTNGGLKTSTGGTDPYTSATVGIMNAFAKIFGAFSKPDSTQAQLTFNQQILALAAEKEAQRKRNQKIATIVVVGLILGTITFLAFYAKKNKVI